MTSLFALSVSGASARYFTSLSLCCCIWRRQCVCVCECLWEEEKGKESSDQWHPHWQYEYKQIRIWESKQAPRTRKTEKESLAGCVSEWVRPATTTKALCETCRGMIEHFTFIWRHGKLIVARVAAPLLFSRSLFMNFSPALNLNDTVFYVRCAAMACRHM